jgi:hypothetical protein
VGFSRFLRSQIIERKVWFFDIVRGSPIVIRKIADQQSKDKAGEGSSQP